MQKHLTSTQNLSEKANYNPKLLDFSAKLWFIITTIGQWLFGVYIILVYQVSTFTGNFEKWNTVLPKGYVPNDFKGNLIVGIHVVLAAIIVIGGPLQIIPKIREQFPTFHRWLGRVYVITAIIVSLAGLIMVWTRGTVGDLTQHVNISIQSVYIVIFAVFTIKSAREKYFTKHKMWALRLFMVCSGVWFFRVGLMAWLIINQAPVGFNPKTFSGPFLSVLSTVVYSIPISLILLEMYFYAKKAQNQRLSYLTSIIILLFTIITAIGVFGATMGLWLPRI